MKEQLAGLEKEDGNIDVLSHRISNVRTWSYVSNKKNWVENSDYWVQLTKDIEDKLSNKLHEELTRSFIDKKISILSRNLKQDLVLNTEIDNQNKILIDGQFIGELKGLKFNVAITANTLDTDIRSIKKAARKGIKEELSKRIEEIISKKEITLDKENKIIWKKEKIAKLKKGYNYLTPEIEIITDDSLDNDLKIKLELFLKNWLETYLKETLGDLINLTKVKIDNQYLRALSFQLYEQNGVIKREIINHIVKLIPEDERKKLWSMGVKIGRYHIYLPKMLKPKAVTFRISLWKLFYNLSNSHDIPQSGLNFISEKPYNDKFMLLCGFEKFKEFFVRIDILEKLFIKIIEKTKDKKIIINTEMMNLLGCSRENFHKLMIIMNYKKEKEPDTYVYKGNKKNKRDKKFFKSTNKENPFNKLATLNLK